MTAAERSQKPPSGSDPTLDAEEVKRFSRLASEWWDPQGKFRPLHQIGPPRLSFIRDKAIEDFFPRCEGAEAAQRSDRSRHRLRWRACRRAARTDGCQRHGDRSIRTQYRNCERPRRAARPGDRLSRAEGRRSRRGGPRRSISSPAWRSSSTCPTQRSSSANVPL